MANVNVEKRSTQNQQQGERGMTRQGEYDPARELFAHPFTLMRRLSDELDRAFASSFGLSNWPSWGEESGAGMRGWSPRVEVRERDNNLVVCADLPGVNKDDVRVEVTNDGMLIRGERKREHEEKQGEVYRSERSYGSFSRLIPLPEGVDADKIEAHFKDGVLEVKVPIPESQRTQKREVPIKT